ncbi:MAG: fused response regulator/phosphatase [Hyphomicrobiales bacterium]|nr:fused response regulator/phosphatase [Hyphomicrobiales bacterium]
MSFIFSEQVDQLIDDQIKKARILIVDDAAFNRMIVKEIYLANGFVNLDFAADGEEALRKTMKIHPDLVVLDIMMPKLDGTEYCSRIRKNTEFKQMPILVQSTLVNSETKAKIFTAGATDFIGKPIDPKELIARTNIHLENQNLVRRLVSYQERIKSEVDQAADMLGSLLPEQRQIDVFSRRYQMQIGSFFKPISEIGGDFWGQRPISEKQFAFYIVDFSGHGIHSAINVFRFHTIMTEKKIVALVDPGGILTELNTQLNQLLGKGHFATVFYGIVDIAQNVLLYSGTGSPQPLLYERETGRVQALDSSGIPLGVLPDVQYDTKMISFRPDDALLLYSDAYVEAENENGEHITEEDLKANFSQMCQTGTLSAQQIVDTLVQNFQERVGNFAMDDLTLNIYRRTTGQ